jgi:hypothetical protein
MHIAAPTPRWAKIGLIVWYAFCAMTLPIGLAWFLMHPLG